MHYDCDLLIVGAGPAGSIMALEAERQGLSVVLVDRSRFPRDKTCGDAIPIRSRAIWRDYGLGEAIAATRHALASRMTVYAGERTLTVPCPPERLLLCRRIEFDDALFQAARAVVDTRQEHRVTGLMRSDRGLVHGVVGSAPDGRSFRYRARIVAGADGFQSIVARGAGLYQREPEHWAVATRAYYRGVSMSPDEIEVYYFDERRPSYLWIFPVDAHTVNVGIGRITTKHHGQRPLRALHEQLLRSSPHAERFAGAERLGPIKGWNLPLASKRRVIHGDGLILAGDAAGLVDPLWGHGVDTAMLSGQIAGRVLAPVCRGEDYRAARLAGYADAVWEQLGPEFERGLQSRRECFEGEPAKRWDPLPRLNEGYFDGLGRVVP